MKSIRISELKGHLSENLRAVEGGEVVEVTDRKRPIARIVPIERAPDGLELIPALRPFASVRRVRLPRLKLRTRSLEALRLERGSR